MVPSALPQNHTLPGIFSEILAKTLTLELCARLVLANLHSLWPSQKLFRDAMSQTRLPGPS